MKRLALLILCIFVLMPNLWSQEPPWYHFTFEVKERSVLDEITLLVSIDKVEGNTVYAYANQKQFATFKTLGIDYSLIEETKAAKALTMAATVAEMALWDRYPTYEVYEQMMQGFAASHPEICQLVEIGTLASGRKLLTVKISDNVSNDRETEPQLFYTSSMHGDEIAGFVMMLRLIDYLLNNYSNSALPEISRLINNSVIWINPLANPNGTYKGGNQSVSGAIRYNSNYVDLNRNFPDPAAGNHPDGNSWQEETLFMMAFADSFPISLSANFHSGTEVVNYPWDTWSALSADDLWWRYVGGNYRDSAQANSPAGYFDGINNGLTNGYLWYRITGGRQDYMNYFKHGREFTVEITNEFFYSSTSLPNLWNYNRAALLGYLSEGLNGVQGTVVTSHGEPVAARVTVLNHDFTHSEVYSQLKTGFFSRYLKAGNYTFTFSAAGFTDAVIPNVKVIDGQLTPLNVILNQEQEQFCLMTDSINRQLIENSMDSVLFLISNCGNVPLHYTAKLVPDTIPNWVTSNKTANTIPVGAKDTIILFLDAHSLSFGTYFSHLIIQASDTVSVPVTMNIIPLQELTLFPNSFNYRKTIQDSILDSIWVFNSSNETTNLTVQFDKSWLVLNDSMMLLAPNDSDFVGFNVSSGALSTGFYSAHITMDGDARAKISVEIAVDTLPIIRMHGEYVNKEVLIHSVTTDTVWVTNIGGGFAKLLVSSNQDWLQPETSELTVLSDDTAAMILNLTVDELPKGIYYGAVTFSNGNNTYTYSIQVTIDTLPELYIPVDSMLVLVNQGTISVDTLIIANRGGGKLTYEVSEFNPNSWLTVEPKLGIINAEETINILLAFDARSLLSGDYSSNILVNGKNIELMLTVLESPKIEFNKVSFFAALSQSQLYSDTLVINNLGTSILNYSIKIVDELNQPWVQLSKTSNAIPAGGKESVVLVFSSDDLPVGTYRTHLEITAGKIIRIPLLLNVIPMVK